MNESAADEYPPAVIKFPDSKSGGAGWWGPTPKVRQV